MTTTKQNKKNKMYRSGTPSAILFLFCCLSILVWWMIIATLKRHLKAKKFSHSFFSSKKKYGWMNEWMNGSFDVIFFHFPCVCIHRRQCVCWFTQIGILGLFGEKSQIISGCLQQSKHTHTHRTNWFLLPVVVIIQKNDSFSSLSKKNNQDIFN